MRPEGSPGPVEGWVPRPTFSEGGDEQETERSMMERPGRTKGELRDAARALADAAALGKLHPADVDRFTGELLKQYDEAERRGTGIQNLQYDFARRSAELPTGSATLLQDILAAAVRGDTARKDQKFSELTRSLSEYASKEVQPLRDRVEELRGLLAQREHTISERDDELDRIQSRLRATEAEKRQWQQDHSELRTQLAEIERLREALENVRATFRILEHWNLQLQKEKLAEQQALETQLAQSRAETLAQRRRADQLESERGDWIQDLEEYRTRAETLEAELQASRRELEELRAQKAGSAPAEPSAPSVSTAAPTTPFPTERHTIESRDRLQELQPSLATLRLSALYPHDKVTDTDRRWDKAEAGSQAEVYRTANAYEALRYFERARSTGDQRKPYEIFDDYLKTLFPEGSRSRRASHWSAGLAIQEGLTERGILRPAADDAPEMIAYDQLNELVQSNILTETP